MLSFPVHDQWTLAVTAVNRARRTRSEKADLIIPRIYLADYYTACNAAELSRLAVTHVVSVIEHVPNLPSFIQNDHKLQIKVADRPNVNLLEQLDETTSFIRTALEENDANIVLVHCLVGISRSATVVCGYLIATMKMTAKEAVTHVRSRRPIVNPNYGFRQQLESYAIKHGVSGKPHDTPPPTSWGSFIGKFKSNKNGTLNDLETEDIYTE
ncbi:hypothetical protein AX17_002638 [Amanita inopinata Kibby_2008]|nr:hypothetical protein AX17_002638 [Amanita inopinata Kibby_2008]